MAAMNPSLSFSLDERTVAALLQEDESTFNMLGSLLPTAASAALASAEAQPGDQAALTAANAAAMQQLLQSYAAHANQVRPFFTPVPQIPQRRTAPIAPPAACHFMRLKTMILRLCIFNGFGYYPVSGSRPHSPAFSGAVCGRDPRMGTRAGSGPPRCWRRCAPTASCPACSLLRRRQTCSSRTGSSPAAQAPVRA